MSQITQAIIDLTALRDNIRYARQCGGQQKIIAMIKANAYGHGIIEVADALQSATDMFSQFKLQTVVHCQPQITALRQQKLATPLVTWLKIDSGMGRLGFLAEHVLDAWQMLLKLDNVVKPLRLMTHLASADELSNPLSDQQCNLFRKTIQNLPNHQSSVCSIANSAGILYQPQSHADWARPGIMLYGIAPSNQPHIASQHQQHLRPVMRLESTLISIKQYQRGQSVGYGATWHCPEGMPVGVVAIGYGDGYPRHAKTGTPVLINGNIVPLVGRVSMDMITVDLRPCPTARCGDRVELWGTELLANYVADAAETISYELFSQITPRVKRIYS